MRRDLPLPRELWDQIPPWVQAALWVRIESYEQRIAAREAEGAELKGQLQQNSQNSWRPSSTDRPEVKRTPPRAPSGGKRGAQPGPPRYKRPLVPLEQGKEVIPYMSTHGWRCGAALHGDAPPLCATQ
jgi:hypothetical protein